MGDVRHRTVPCLKILLGGFLLFIRGIMVFLPIIIVVIMMLFLRKKTRKSLVIAIILGVVISVFIPIRMFLLNQKQIPNIDTNGLFLVYEEFKLKLNNGQGKINDSNIINSNEFRSIYKNADESTILIFVYDSSLNDEINYLKDTAAVHYTNGSVSIWASEMEPTSFAWYAPIVGVTGEFVMQSNNNEMLLVHYCIRDFDGFNVVFPKYPKFDILSYLISCDVLV